MPSGARIGLRAPILAEQHADGARLAARPRARRTGSSRAGAPATRATQSTAEKIARLRPAACDRRATRHCRLAQRRELSGNVLVEVCSPWSINTPSSDSSPPCALATHSRTSAQVSVLLLHRPHQQNLLGAAGEGTLQHVQQSVERSPIIDYRLSVATRTMRIVFPRISRHRVRGADYQWVKLQAPETIPGPGPAFPSFVSRTSERERALQDVQREDRARNGTELTRCRCERIRTQGSPARHVPGAC